MDAKDLKFFEVVARCEGMKRAAAELNTVQSNVTARIRRLEDQLGTTLFERRSDGMKLTSAGIRLLPFAFEVRASIANAQRAVSDVGKPSGQLLVGFRKTTASIHLTNILTDYVPAFPDVDICVRAETTPILKDLVITRKLEGAFVCEPIEDNELIREPIFDEELVIFTAPHITDLSSLSLDDTRMIVLGQGGCYRRLLEETYARWGFSAKRVMELGSLESILNCVGAGLGITLMPRTLVNSLSDPDLVRAHTIKDRECRVRTVFIRRRDTFFSSALSAFLECVRSYAESIDAHAISA